MNSSVLLAMVVFAVGSVLFLAAARKRKFEERCASVNGTAIGVPVKRLYIRNDSVILNKE